MCTFPCKHNCCQRTFCPLELAHARTVHSFQGLQAGPVEEGKQPNMWEALVCDVDEKFWEGKSLGLMRAATSRGTTLGADDGLGSAVCFDGPAFTKSRIKDLTFAENTNKEFELSMKRRRWVAFLHQQAQNSQPRTDSIVQQAETLVQWSQETRISRKELHQRTDNCKPSMATNKRKHQTI